MASTQLRRVMVMKNDRARAHSHRLCNHASFSFSCLFLYSLVGNVVDSELWGEMQRKVLKGRSVGQVHEVLWNMLSKVQMCAFWDLW